MIGGERMGRNILGLLVLSFLISLAPYSVAQETPPRVGDNPFEEEFDYRVGDQLELNVSIDGLVWRLFTIDGGDPADHTSDKEVRTEIGLEAENSTNSSLTLTIILLLEDPGGNQLQRVELKSFKVSGGRLKQDVQKIRINGAVLAEMGKIYFFAEVD